MHYIQLGFHIKEDMALKSVTMDINTTDLPNDSNLLRLLAITLLKSLSANKDDVIVQDLLNELDIKKSK